MNPFFSWGVVLAIAAGGYIYYNQGAKLLPARGGAAVTETLKLGPSKREERARRKPAATSASELSGSDTPAANQQVDKQHTTSKGKPKHVPLSPAITVRDSDADSNAQANHKFATSMLKAKEGTKLQPPVKNSGRTKTVKTSGLSAASPTFSSSASSTGGVDADVEFSPLVSPTLRAGDVSDMLEPTTPGPSVLRLTVDPDKAAPRQKAPPKEYQVAESKRQRQNKQKNEDRKAANAASELERQKLLEQQRKTAREARGEPAKNGLQPAKAPSSNSWSAKPAGAVAPTHAAPPVEPLVDIVDRAAEPAVGNAQVSIVATTPVPHVNGGTSINGTSKASEYANGLSEDDQIHLATKASMDEDGWNEVSTKKGKAKASLAAPQTGRSNNAVQPPAAPSAPSGRFAGLEVDD